MDQYGQAAAELMRAIRGGRSQRAFAKRLGYKGNPATDWEHGRHFPTAAEALRAATCCKLDVNAAFRTFSTEALPEVQNGHWVLYPWLAALKGSMTQTELAERCGCSRFSIRRWLTGQGEPKLPEFLRLLDAMSGRAFDWVAALVPIDQLPSLTARHAQAQAAKTLAVEHPWTEALLRLLETQEYQASPHSDEQLANALGLPKGAIPATLALLADAGVVDTSAGRYRVVGNLAVDTRGVPGGIWALQAHWAEVAAARARYNRNANQADPFHTSADWYAYNVISVSVTDLALVQDRMKQAYADIRSIVAASEPAERAALVNLQLIKWDMPPQRRGALSQTNALLNQPAPSRSGGGKSRERL